MESAEADLRSSEVRVKGVFEPAKLVGYIYKRTRKHAAIVNKSQKTRKRKPAKMMTAKKRKRPRKMEATKGTKVVVVLLMLRMRRKKRKEEMRNPIPRQNQKEKQPWKKRSTKWWRFRKMHFIITHEVMPWKCMPTHLRSSAMRN